MPLMLRLGHEAELETIAAPSCFSKLGSESDLFAVVVSRYFVKRCTYGTRSRHSDTQALAFKSARLARRAG